MAYHLKKLYEFYTYVNDELADRRVITWPLMSSPWSSAAIISMYLYFCLNAGPKLMKGRQPFNVDWLIIIYDLIQIVTCGWIALQGILYYFPTRYKFYCQPVDYSNEDFAVYVAELVWLFHILKLVDLLDTVFFVLRKKDNQVTFFHMYHHVVTVICSYVMAKYFAGGHFILLGQVNSFVHAVMYSYYLASNINSEYKKAVWWKKYITQLQIGQFVLLCVQYLPTLFWENCDVSYGLRLLLIMQFVFMLLLFFDFYRKAYRVSKTAD